MLFFHHTEKTSHSVIRKTICDILTSDTSKDNSFSAADETLICSNVSGDDSREAP